MKRVTGTNFFLTSTGRCRIKAYLFIIMVTRKEAARHPSGFIDPCRPTKAVRPPSGPDWVHEIKHDGFRLLARKEGSRVRCFTRGGHDWADRFPAIVEAAKGLQPQSFMIDGEAVICRPDGVSDFDALRLGRRAHEVTLAAFDLIELQAADLRKEPLFNRKQRLARILSGGPKAIVYNEHITHDGPTVFDHACRLGLEGIVSKRLDSPYRSGAVKTWLKSKNPLSEAVRRETEEDWS
jgi:bifunctional non-homologous end joining protein LigD